MKLLYTHENHFLVNNAKNIVEIAGIDVLMKNEYASGAVGDLAPLDTWLELWVINEADHQKADKIIQSVMLKSQGHDWFCSHCAEKNDPSFEICWNCQHEDTTNNN